MKKIEIPDELDIVFKAKEIGELRNYLSENFIHSKVAHIIAFLENRMIESYPITTQDETIPPPVGGGGGGPVKPNP